MSNERYTSPTGADIETSVERDPGSAKPSSTSSVPDMKKEQYSGYASGIEANKVAAPENADYQVSFTGDDDPLSPRSMSNARKWMIVVIISTTALCVSCTSSIYAETYAQIMSEFRCSEEVATLGLSIFVVGLALSPMVLAPLSEFYGRKPVYIFSLLAFVIWKIPCAVAQNIQTLLIARFFDGLAGSAFLSVAGGTVGDLFPAKQLQAPMMLFTISPFLGPELGPILGGFINYYTNWRWTFWVMMIWAGVQWMMVTFLVPETYHPVLLRNEARRLRHTSGNESYFAPLEKIDRSVGVTVLRSTYRPFLLLALEPMCLNLCIYSSLILGILYLFFGAFNLVFINNHGFSLWQCGLSFLGMTVGMILGISTNPFWHKNYLRLLARHEQRTGSPGSEPEYRLPPAIGGSPLITIGLLLFGWTTYSHVHWILPIIGSAIFGAGVVMIYSGIFTFLVDAYPLYAASAMAANSFSRSMFAAAFPLFGNIMFKNMGYQWASFTLAMISLAMAPLPWIFYRYGKWFRMRSSYASKK
ncbi:Efflux pump atB [Lachnellula suecica]|uniref:Efflux pump atB n=1 Tax=Lachnellula suecica TaxID=602035 RepID=A0A8T9C6G5_9HELO|nr:Efflux pump atB [Lachnellula suecica]